MRASIYKEMYARGGGGGGVLPPGIHVHLFVNMAKFGLLYFREYAKDDPESSQIN